MTTKYGVLVRVPGASTKGADGTPIDQYGIVVTTRSTTMQGKDGPKTMRTFKTLLYENTEEIEEQWAEYRRRDVGGMMGHAALVPKILALTVTDEEDNILPDIKEHCYTRDSIYNQLCGSTVMVGNEKLEVLYVVYERMKAHVLRPIGSLVDADDDQNESKY
jgi:hypothetical protein